MKADPKLAAKLIARIREEAGLKPEKKLSVKEEKKASAKEKEVTA
jgi:hypothetical protein